MSKLQYMILDNEWCGDSCPYLAKIIGNDGRRLMCLEYGQKLLECKAHPGKCCKCEACLCDMKAIG